MHAIGFRYNIFFWTKVSDILIKSKNKQTNMIEGKMNQWWWWALGLRWFSIYHFLWHCWL